MGAEARTDCPRVLVVVVTLQAKQAWQGEALGNEAWQSVQAWPSTSCSQGCEVVTLDWIEGRFCEFSF